MNKLILTIFSQIIFQPTKWASMQKNPPSLFLHDNDNTGVWRSCPWDLDLADFFCLVDFLAQDFFIVLMWCLRW